MPKKTQELHFVVARPLWSRVHNRQYGPGEEITFPLNPAPDAEGKLPDGAIIVNFDLLLAEGTLIPYDEALKAGIVEAPDTSEVSNG